MKPILFIVLAFMLVGPPIDSDLQSVDCWTSCSTCKAHCKDRECRSMCENMNRVCCGSAGKRPYLSGCGCQSE